jgi:alkylated DNA repair dioxygenase AlkB
MKLHRDSLENLFVNHHNQLKLGTHQAKNSSHDVDDLMGLSLCKSCIFCFLTHIEAFQFLFNFA